MFGWLRHRGLRLGARVIVLAGPYAGSSGWISELATDGRFRVTIDDCCQPSVAAADLRVLDRRSFYDKAIQAEKTIDDNPEVSFVGQLSQRVRSWW